MEDGTIRICADCPRRDRHDERPCNVIRKGKPRRKGVRLPNGEKTSVRVQEYRCDLHGKYRVCPLFLLPHKHYVAEIVEEALAAPIFKENVKAFCNRWEILDAASPTRWIREFGKRLVTVAKSAERRLLGLCPSWRSKDPPIPETSWTYAYVWNLLESLQEACRKAGLEVPYRAHFAFL